jgi:hypothetical protein
VFRPDAGVDTGPIVAQKGGVAVRDTDTAATLYFERLYPLGGDAVVEAVDLVASGAARYSPQDESKATFQGLVGDAEARIDWSREAALLDRQIAAAIRSPGRSRARRRGRAPPEGRLLPAAAAGQERARRRRRAAHSRRGGARGRPRARRAGQARRERAIRRPARLPSAGPCEDRRSRAAP